MDNMKIAQVFEEIADIMDIKGENFFKINAYRKAALTIQNLSKDLRIIAEKEPAELDAIPGIGRALKDKIIELIQTGKCEFHEQLKAEFPEGLLQILRLRGVGPKKVKLFYSQLGIGNIQQLKEAAENGLLGKLEGMGPKSENEILKAIGDMATLPSERRLISEALMEAERIIAHMKTFKDLHQIQYAGSLRRCQETIGDIDIVCAVKTPGKDYEKAMRHFTSYSEALEILSEGDTKSSILLRNGMQADLRVVEKDSFGAALHYFTGSKDHNIKMRDIAKKSGMKLNEYALLRGEKVVAGKTEEEIFKALGLPYIIPEIRKDDGEIEYGLEHGKFPRFIELDDIRGDLHNHSKYSDGKETVEKMAEAFMARGYEYCGMSDHSSVMAITRGMGSKEIKAQWEEIDELNKKFAGKFKIFKSCEVDILKDGSLDFSDEILKQLDFVIVSAHIHQKLPEEEQTARILAALENPYVSILAHPTGRLLNQRPEMKFDMEKVMNACVQNGVALEINSNPVRLDLTDKYVRMGKEKGAKFVINTDSHSVSNQEFMKFGVGMARRGWLEKDDVLNTMSASDLTAHFRKV